MKNVDSFLPGKASCPEHSITSRPERVQGEGRIELMSEIDSFKLVIMAKVTF